MTPTDIRSDLLRRQHQRFTSTTAQYAQSVWKNEILLNLFDECGIADTKINLIEWNIKSNKLSVFEMGGFPVSSIFKLITPLREFWYSDCGEIVFTGVQHRPTNKTSEQIEERELHYDNSNDKEYVHSSMKCAMYDMPCRQWMSCQRNCTGYTPRYVRTYGRPRYGDRPVKAPAPPIPSNYVDTPMRNERGIQEDRASEIRRQLLEIDFTRRTAESGSYALNPYTLYGRQLPQFLQRTIVRPTVQFVMPESNSTINSNTRHTPDTSNNEVD